MYYPLLDDAITLHLRKTGKTQATLAKELGMSENSLSWKRRGTREFTLGEAAKVAKITGLEAGLSQVLEGAREVT